MLVLRAKPYARTSPVIDDEELYFAAGDEGAWFLQRGYTWKYRATYRIFPAYATGDNPSHVAAQGALDEDSWSWRAMQWPSSPSQIFDTDDLPSSVINIDEDYQYSSSNWPTWPTWPTARTSVSDDGDVVSPTVSVDDDASFTYKNRVPAWRLFYPSRRGGSPDSNAPTTPLGVEDDSWLAGTQRLSALARSIIDDEVLSIVPPFAGDDEPAFIYRNRISAWKLFYPARRGGSPDSNAAAASPVDEDDLWTPPRQIIPWRMSRAILEDESYVVNTTEDYLWITTQQFYETPLVSITDDEIKGTPVTFGLDEDFAWTWRAVPWWPLPLPIVSYEPAEQFAAPQTGGRTVMLFMD